MEDVNEEDEIEELLDEDMFPGEADYSKASSSTEIQESTKPDVIEEEEEKGELNEKGKKTKKAKKIKTSEKRLIEAALFMSSSPVPINRLAKLIGVSAPGYVKRKLKELKSEYDRNNSAIEIAEEDNSFFMTVRSEFVPYVKDFAKETELSRPSLRALGYISKHNGVLKSYMVKRLGTWVYSAVRELVEKNFIIAKRAGRSKKLYLSKKFRDYFGKNQI